MNITLASIFTQSQSYLPRYFAQCVALADALHARGDRLTCLWGEGDSTDNTLAMLSDMRWRLDSRVVDVSHGGPMFPGVAHAVRFKQLAYVGNIIWAAIPEQAEALVYIESDLIWETDALVGLIDRLVDYPAISPMVFLDRRGWSNQAFYDTWAARKDGRHFEHYPPYHPCYRPGAPFLVDSMGSAMAIGADLARRLFWPEEDVFVGLCRQIYELGEAVYIDPTIAVWHK